MKTFVAKPLWRRVQALFRRRDPAPSALFRAAWRHGAPVTVSFVDQRHLRHTVECRIKNIRHGRVELALVWPLPAAVADHCRCSLYFKLPPAVLRRKWGLKAQPAQNGFLSSGVLVPGLSDAQGQICHMSIAMPYACIRHELRHHERYRIFSGHVAEAGFRMAGQGAEEARAFHAARIVDISSGGARALVENVDYLDEFSRLDGARLVLRLGLNLLSGKRLITVMNCQCVGARYSIRFRRLTLLLKFLGREDAGTPDFGARREDVEKGASDICGAGEGSQVIEEWLATDYGRILSAAGQLAEA